MELEVGFRRRRLTQDERGYTVWEVVDAPAVWEASKTTLVICDVWQRHWCRGANERVAPMLPRMNELACALRRAGVLIVHAPADGIGFYEGLAARRRVLEAPETTLPRELAHDDPPLPVVGDDTSDTTGDPGDKDEDFHQHAAIEIDAESDAISDEGAEIYNLFVQRGICNFLIMGVHTNMCILDRPYGIKQMVRWGLDAALVRDLTDTMYNPAKAPYVSHEEGTRLVVEYIEKFWCATVTSDDLLSASGTASSM